MMDFVSLKRYLVGSEGEGVYKRVVSLLLNAMVESAVRTNDEEYGRFREGMEKYAGAAREPCTEEQLLFTVGSAVQALDSYNRRTARVLRQQEVELQNIASMLAQTVIAITHGSDRSGEVLAGIKADLEHAAAVEDIQMVRIKLTGCLEKVREEALRQKRESEATVTALQEQIAHAQAMPPPSERRDPVTGLGGRAAALEAFQQSIGTGGRKFVLTMVMERYELIKSRYGSAVADESLRMLRQHVEQNLADAEGVFRWTGPTLVTILRRPDTIDRVRAEVKRVVEGRVQRTFDVGSRSVLVQISSAWSVIGLIPPVVNTAKYIDNFVSSQTPREFAL